MENNKESQLDRIEKKMDRILELLESQDLSTSFEKNFVEISKRVNENFTRFLQSRDIS